MVLFVKYLWILLGKFVEKLIFFDFDFWFWFFVVIFFFIMMMIMVNDLECVNLIGCVDFIEWY